MPQCGPDEADGQERERDFGEEAKTEQNPQTKAFGAVVPFRRGAAPREEREQAGQ